MYSSATFTSLDSVDYIKVEDPPSVRLWKTQRSNVCACASHGATKRRPKYFHDIVLFVGHPHPINDIFLVIYIFVYVLACTTRTNRNRSYELFYLLLVAGLSFPRYVSSALLEFFVRLDFAFSAPVCPRFVV